jgi:hypothetical protein
MRSDAPRAAAAAAASSVALLGDRLAQGPGRNAVRWRSRAWRPSADRAGRRCGDCAPPPSFIWCPCCGALVRAALAAAALAGGGDLAAIGRRGRRTPAGPPLGTPLQSAPCRGQLTFQPVILRRTDGAGCAGKPSLSAPAPAVLIYSAPRLLPVRAHGGRACARWLGPAAAIRIVEIDDDPELVRRYGADIPVLCLDGEVVCRHFLDADRLAAALAQQS